MQRNFVLGAALVAALCPVGCGDDGGTGGQGGQGASTTTTSTGTPTTTTTTGMTTTSGSTSTGMSMCPPDASDPPCTACSKTTCCDQTNVCMADTECTTCMACVAAAANPVDCLDSGDCDLNDAETFAAYDCTSKTCADECYAGGFSCTPEPMGQPCIECVKVACCDSAQACFESAACALCITCAQNAMNPLDCLSIGACDLNDPATAEIFQCVNSDCGVCLQ